MARGVFHSPPTPWAAFPFKNCLLNKTSKRSGLEEEKISSTYNNTREGLIDWRAKIEVSGSAERVHPGAGLFDKTCCKATRLKGRDTDWGENRISLSLSLSECVFQENKREKGGLSFSLSL